MLSHSVSIQHHYRSRSCVASGIRDLQPAHGKEKTSLPRFPDGPRDFVSILSCILNDLELTSDSAI